MSGNRKSSLAIGSAFIASLLATALAAAPPHGAGKSGKAEGKGKAPEQGAGVEASLSILVAAGIGAGDARGLASAHELTGAKPLPPGIRKNLARGKPLPPGIQKTRMPDAFVSRLPLHPGFEWRQAGTDLVLVVSGSLVVSDLLEGVFE